jgi:hypothetical protein
VTNTISLPTAIWTGIGPKWTASELLLLGYLILHGARDRAVMLTDDELLNGRKPYTGPRQDQGCGVSGRNNLKEARERLEGRGCLKTMEGAERWTRIYKVNL